MDGRGRTPSRRHRLCAVGCWDKWTEEQRAFAVAHADAGAGDLGQMQRPFAFGRAASGLHERPIGLSMSDAIM